VQVEHSGGVAYGAVQFEYVDAFVVRSVVPSSGAAGASVVVTVNGYDFLETGMWFRIGSDAAASSCNVSGGGGSAVCVVDAGQMIGRHVFSVSMNSVDWESSVCAFFVSHLNVLSIEPSLFSVFGGTMVTFRGNFGDSFSVHRACKFAAHVENAIIMNSSVVICRAPPFFGSGEVQAYVGDLLANIWLASFHAIYTSIVRVTKVLPSILHGSGSTT
jgi:hypothetical protein